MMEMMLDRMYRTWKGKVWSKIDPPGMDPSPTGENDRRALYDVPQMSAWTAADTVTYVMNPVRLDGRVSRGTANLRDQSQP